MIPRNGLATEVVGCVSEPLTDTFEVTLVLKKLNGEARISFFGLCTRGPPKGWHRSLFGLQDLSDEALLAVDHLCDAILQIFVDYKKIHKLILNYLRSFCTSNL